jgi:phage/plasmid-like protein (TIGR03299 family)
MAHQIFNNEIAYKGEKPWHGLGAEVSADATGAEMLTAAGLDWQIETRKIQMEGNGGSILTENLKSYRAITRSDTEKVFQVASTIYKPVQNAEIVDFFREYCEAGHASMETVGALRGGAVVWALAKLNGTDGDANIGGVDPVKGYVTLATSHDGSIPTTGFATQVRIVCANTMRAAFNANKGQDSFRMVHFQKFDDKKKEEARKMMGIAIEQVQATNEVSSRLSQVSIDADARLEFLERLLLTGSALESIIETQFGHANEGSLLDSAIAQTQRQSHEARQDRLGKVGAAILDAIITSPGSDLVTAKDTLWGACNGVSYYTDHVAREMQSGNRLFKAWFGENDNLKTKALETAMEMAGVKAPAMA